jgi:hypothetical protein
MISFGAVLFDENLETSFYGQLKPISEKWIPEALAVSGHSREQTMEFDCPKEVMQNFADWIDEVNVSGRPMFFSDNNGFDWQFINWYFHHFLERNPFGYSSTNINSIYKGMRNNMRDNIKRMRTTKHTHHPVDDAKGNAEALLKMKNKGLRINF